MRTKASEVISHPRKGFVRSTDNGCVEGIVRGNDQSVDGETTGQTVNRNRKESGVVDSHQNIELSSNSLIASQTLQFDVVGIRSLDVFLCSDEIGVGNGTGYLVNCNTLEHSPGPVHQLHAAHVLSVDPDTGVPNTIDVQRTLHHHHRRSELRVRDAFFEENVHTTRVIQSNQRPRLTLGISEHELWSSFLNGSELGSDLLPFHLSLKKSEGLI